MEICRRRKSTVVLLSVSLVAGLLILTLHLPSTAMWARLSPTTLQTVTDHTHHSASRSEEFSHISKSERDVLSEDSERGRAVLSQDSERERAVLSQDSESQALPGDGGVSVGGAHRESGQYVRSSMPLGPTLKIKHNSNQSAVVSAIRHAWKGYREYAWGADELRPLSKRGSSAPFNMGMTLVDCLDTLWLAGLQEEFDEARSWVSEHLDLVHNMKTVSTFETTIRVLGGLLSAHHLSQDKLFLDKAVELAQRLLPAFKTPSGVPSRVVNLQTGIPDKRVKPLSVAEAGSLQLEFRDVSRLTGDAQYGAAADRDMDVLIQQSGGGMIAMMINPHSGHLQQTDFSVGAGIDSYYEYLLKLWLQSGRAENKFLSAYTTSVKEVTSHLVSHSGPSHLTFIGRARTKSSSPNAVMDHLSCFYPGMLALGAMNSLHSDLRPLAEELTHTCYQAYRAMPSGLAPDIFHFNLRGGKSDFVTRGIPSVDIVNILRPETVESLFYLYRLTGDNKYRDWGWEIFRAFEEHARVDSGGYTSLWSVLNPASKQDKMESFFVSEMLKYLFLLFTDDPSVFRLTEWVFNTEAHPLPVWVDHAP